MTDEPGDLSEETETKGLKLSRKSGGGGKLSRSETVTVRLDPKLNYLCELAARSQRRTKSSFIEWAIEHALEAVSVPGGHAEYGGREATIADVASELWDVDESDRLVKLGQVAPALLTHDEQIIWKIILNNGYFWHGRYDDLGQWIFTYRNPSFSNIGACWEDIRRVAAGELTQEALPKVSSRAPKKLPSAFDEDLDGDVPF